MTTETRTKHTPGPWQLYGQMSGSPTDPDNPPDSRIVVRGAGERFVVDLSCWPDYRDEVLANARLIAAAPTLLAAAQDVEQILGDYFEGDVKTNTVHLHALLMTCRAAIRKTTGKSE